MSNTPQKKQNEPLIEKTIEVCRDRGTVAELRRFWSTATKHYAFPGLGRIGVRDPRSADAMTAALYAINPNHVAGGLRLGQALKKFGDGQESFDAHVRRLLASDSLEDAADQLQRILVRFNGAGVHLDFNTLLWDLRKWTNRSEDVKTSWGKDYWMGQKDVESEEAVAS